MFTALDFIDHDAIDDAWVVMSYLSDADCLLGGSPITSARWIVNESNESDSMSQLIAASVAARGVLFGNAHASPSRYLLINMIIYLKDSELIILLLFGLSRWHTIRSPKVWQIERTFRFTKVSDTMPSFMNLTRL